MYLSHDVGGLIGVDTLQKWCGIASSVQLVPEYGKVASRLLELLSFFDVSREHSLLKESEDRGSLEFQLYFHCLYIGKVNSG